MGRGHAGKRPMPSVLSLLVVLLLLLAFLGTTASGAVAGCPGCARPKPADSIRLEAIKLQILTKLGLKAKPQVKRTLPKEVVLASLSRAGELPFQQADPLQQEPLSSSSVSSYIMSSSSHSGLRDDDSADYDDFYGRTSEIITFAEQDTRQGADRMQQGCAALHSRQRARPAIGPGVSARIIVLSYLVWLQARLQNGCATLESALRKIL